jgi:hypothetical protein
MIVPAPHPLLKWGEMCEWMKANGVRKSELLRYVVAGKIKAHTLPPSQVRHYSADEIQWEILQPLNGTKHECVCDRLRPLKAPN